MTNKFEVVKMNELPVMANQKFYNYTNIGKIPLTKTITETLIKKNSV